MKQFQRLQKLNSWLHGSVWPFCTSKTCNANPFNWDITSCPLWHRGTWAAAIELKETTLLDDAWITAITLDATCESAVNFGCFCWELNDGSFNGSAVQVGGGQCLHIPKNRQITTSLNQLTIRFNDHQGILPLPEDSLGKPTLVFLLSSFMWLWTITHTHKLTNLLALWSWRALQNKDDMMWSMTVWPWLK